MEDVASISEGDWSSLSGMYFTEEADFMAQLLGNHGRSQPSIRGSSEPPSVLNPLIKNPSSATVNGNCSFPNELPSNSNNNYGVSSGYWNIGHESNVNMLGVSSGFLFPPPSHESYYSSHSRPILMRNDSSITTERSLMDTNNPIEADDYFVNNQDNVSKDNMEFDENMAEPLLDGKGLQLGRIDYERFPEGKMDLSPTESSKKRARQHGHVPKNKRSTKLQTDVKTGEMDGKNKSVLQRQNSMISCVSEDECNDSLELTRKSRASTGSATDPQSLYARKRRERINERLKTLQSLIPNGTKVDISTMLEEAVQYVKFLQLQIKLLSSDDLWMYAPIAYNGMDLGLDLRIAIPK